MHIIRHHQHLQRKIKPNIQHHHQHQHPATGKFRSAKYAMLQNSVFIKAITTIICGLCAISEICLHMAEQIVRAHPIHLRHITQVKYIPNLRRFCDSFEFSNGVVNINRYKFLL